MPSHYHASGAACKECNVHDAYYASDDGVPSRQPMVAFAFGQGGIIQATCLRRAASNQPESVRFSLTGGTPPQYRNLPHFAFGLIFLGGNKMVGTAARAFFRRRLTVDDDPLADLEVAVTITPATDLPNPNRRKKEPSRRLMPMMSVVTVRRMRADIRAAFTYRATRRVLGYSLTQGTPSVDLSVDHAATWRARICPITG